MGEDMDAILNRLPSGALTIDGKTAAAEVLRAVAATTCELIKAGTTPGLAVVLVGEDTASQVYVRSKGRAANQCGFHSEQISLPATTSEPELLAVIDRLNADRTIHGILVQLPLPKPINTAAVLAHLASAKDVDGFHPLNAGLLAIGEIDRALVPCTPAGAMVLLRRTAQALGRPLAGQRAVVVGRSNIVGKPMAQLLLAENCTVTIAHSRSRNLPDIVGSADVVVASVGRPEVIRGNWLARGAIVIDVGINRVAGEGGKDRLVGDVAFAEAIDHVGAITPVPGGVGPMTIAMLMANTCTAACRLTGHPAPKILSV
jgi:methylenetetrahydrofolate dehydrogenase (NADP+)/methenyltetrahydrofolate cyclohydrolase